MKNYSITQLRSNYFIIKFKGIDIGDVKLYANVYRLHLLSGWSASYTKLDEIIPAIVELKLKLDLME